MRLLELQSTSDGVTLLVRAKPGAKKNSIQGVNAGMMKVSVTSAPEDGKANAAIVQLLSKAFKISKSRVQLLAGATQRQKKVLLVGLDAAAVTQLVESL